jgi:hypothetical protein
VTSAPDQELDRGHPKTLLKFIINKLTLGNFKADQICEDQELVVDKVLQECLFFTTTVPRTHGQVQKSKDWLKWKGAINEELLNLKGMGVWSALLCPAGKLPLNGRWDFAEKTNNQSETIRWKARYVAKGFTQMQGINFEKTFVPKATFVSMRLLLSIAAAFQWPVWSFDFEAAYLNSPIDE